MNQRSLHADPRHEGDHRTARRLARTSRSLRARLASAALVLLGGPFAHAQAIDPLVEGQLLVGANDSQLPGFLASLATQVESFELLDSIDGRDVHLVGYDLAPGASLDAFDAWLEAQALGGAVRFGELNYEGQAGEGRTDSLWVSQLGTAPRYGSQYALDRIGAHDARERSGGWGVVVAILDTGIDDSHPALAGIVLAQSGASFVSSHPDWTDQPGESDDDGDGLVDEMWGHGTFVAGLVHVVAPDSRLLPVRVLDSDGRGDLWTLTAGLWYAIDAGAHVVNMSLGTTYDSRALEEAMDFAEMNGIVVTGAIGNLDREEPREFPAADSFGIAALDELDRKAPFSSFGDKVVVSVPGHSVPIPGKPGRFDLDRSIISTTPDGGFGIWRGTSFSTAIVSGVIAQVRAQRPEWPNATTPAFLVTETIENWIEATAVNIDAQNPGFDGLLGAGRLDAAALTLLSPLAPQRGDLNLDGRIDGADLAAMLSSWGKSGGGSLADLDLDGDVDGADLTELLARWG